MSDTPRTDEAEIRCIDEPVEGLGMVEVDFARQLERELAAVTAERDRLRERVERLEEAGDNLDDRIACGCGVDGPCTSCRGASDAWTKAKEAKP
jgi:hypothetical protein